MYIRFGYAASCLGLYEASPSRTMTYKRYGVLGPAEGQQRLLEITEANLLTTLRILYYNTAQKFGLYRLSSSIVPLATHPDVQWDFVSPFAGLWAELGDWIRRHRLRVSFHPSQFTLFTSSKPHITENSVRDLLYHHRMLEAMQLPDTATMNIHVGGSYGDKEAATVRFHENIRMLPAEAKKRLTLENDDKTYTAEETLAICQKEGIPFVFDYHHHMANPGSAPLDELLEETFATWEHTGLPPKIHVSSPKDERNFRAHADYVDPAFIRPLADALKRIGKDADFMIEAKAKDLAMMQLIADLSKVRGIKRIDGGTLEL